MKWVWITLTLFVLALLTGIIYDLRFAIVACMILFLMFPMELVMIYIYYGLREECSFNVVDHRVIISQEYIKIEMRFFNHANSEEKDNLDDKCPEDNDKSEEDIPQIRKLQFPVTEMGRFTVLTDSIALRINQNRGFLWIPVSAFDNETLFKKFIDNILAYAVA